MGEDGNKGKKVRAVHAKKAGREQRKGRTKEGRKAK